MLLVKNASPKKILLSSGRSPVTLHLARQLHAAGHQVYVADATKVHLCIFSNAVTKNFHIPSPRFSPKEYLEAILKIVTDEKIDLLIPVYEEILYLTKEETKFPSYCKIFASSFSLLNELHNKWLFCTKQQGFGIKTPNTFLIRTQDDLNRLDPSRSYALKACYSRASLNMKKLNVGESLPNLCIETHNPWIAQEWLSGKKFCTYSICQQGKIKAHATYPVRFAIDGNSCLTFESIEHQKIYEWIENFVEKAEFTGQIAFDFIEDGNNLYAIECNPRATSGVFLFEASDQMDQAFLNQSEQVLFPKKGAAKQVASGMLLYGWKKSSYPANTMRNFLKTLMRIRDVVFHSKDLKPFFSIPIVFAAFLYSCKKSSLTLPEILTFDNEWNGEIIP